MVCKNCGNYLNDSASFCTKCGARVESSETNGAGFFQAASLDLNTEGGTPSSSSAKYNVNTATPYNNTQSGETTVLSGNNPYNSNFNNNSNGVNITKPKSGYSNPNTGYNNNSTPNYGGGTNPNYNNNNYNRNTGASTNNNYNRNPGGANPNYNNNYNRNTGAPVNNNYNPANGGNRPYLNINKTDYSLLKYILLSLITFGIYGIYIMSHISTEINNVATRYDGKKTMHYCLVVFIFAGLTLGIVPLVWFHRISERMGNELRRRGMNYDFSATTFWLWDVLGSLIFVGPFIYFHKMFTAMNMINSDFNARGC